MEDKTKALSTEAIVRKENLWINHLFHFKTSTTVVMQGLYTFIALCFFFSVGKTEFVSDQQKDDAAKMLKYLTEGAGKGTTYDWLKKFTDTIGNRYVVSERYDQAVNYMVDYLKNDIGVDKVWTEDVTNVPGWLRGQDEERPDHAWLTSPRKYYIPITALAASTSTLDGNFADVGVTVVKSFDELEALPNEKVQDRIIVYNQEYTATSGRYRTRGGSEAAKRGAKAVLVRSNAPFSIYTLHTGNQFYELNQDPSTYIPAASITVEDAQLLSRLQDEGNDLKITLVINSTWLGMVTKKNVIAEITGENPHEMVLFGGHLDSWDVGTGALDDGGGVAVTVQTLRVIKELGFKPKRTLRAVFWAAEEEIYIGAKAYYEKHKTESGNISLVMESDTGTFTPLGFHFSGSHEACKIMTEVMALFKGIDASTLDPNPNMAPGDPGEFNENDGVPGVELMTDTIDFRSSKYFLYHHTNADTISILNPTDLDRCSAVFSITAYTVAGLQDLLPHSKDFTTERCEPVSSAVYSTSSCVFIILGLSFSLITQYL